MGDGLLIRAAGNHMNVRRATSVRGRRAARRHPPVAEDERRRSGGNNRRSYEPRLALRRVQSAVLALVIITVVGIFGYVVFEGWSFTDASYDRDHAYHGGIQRGSRARCIRAGCGPCSS